MDININKKEGSVIEVEGKIPFEDIEKNRNKTIKQLGSEIEMKGFRKGKVPEKVLVEKIGEDKVLEKMAEISLQEAYPKILLDNKINPIAQPKINITKLASGNPMEFKIEIPTMPEFDLPDYKSLAKKIEGEDVEVKEKEVEDTIEQVLESRKSEDGKKPELTDEFAQSIGDFKDVADLQKKIKEGVKMEKEKQSKDKRRAGILEEIIKETDIDLPDLIVDSELQKMLAQFKGDVERMQMKWQDYLEKTGKSEDDLRKEWRADAEKRAKSQLIMNKIAVEEELIADKEEIEKEVQHILSHHKDADPERAKVFAEQILTNEKVFEFLEQQ